jgi:hypothetical protein
MRWFFPEVVQPQLQGIDEIGNTDLANGRTRKGMICASHDVKCHHSIAPPHQPMCSAGGAKISGKRGADIINRYRQPPS